MFKANREVSMNAIVHLHAPVPSLPVLRDPLEQIAEFLSVPLPGDFAVPPGSEVTLLDYDSGMTKVIRERRPWFILDRCVAIKAATAPAGRLAYTVWSVATFTEASVQGHFPGGKGRIPFVDLAKMVAQTASVAAALQANNPGRAPVGIGSDGSDAEADDLIPVPATVLARVSVKALKGGVMCFFDQSVVYHNATRIGKIEGIRYFMRDAPDLPFI
jgi:hypothetical protein